MKPLNRFIGMKLNSGGIVVGATRKDDYVEFRVVIDGQTEIHNINVKESVS